MRISGFFRPGPLEAAYIRAKLSIPKLRIKRQIELVIDTGASRTIISDRDALWLGIDYRELEKAGESIGIGGGVSTFRIPDAVLTFVTENGEPFEFKQPIFVTKHKKVDDRIKRIPNILGRDFLNRFTFVYDRGSEKAMITDE